MRVSATENEYMTFSKALVNNADVIVLLFRQSIGISIVCMHQPFIVIIVHLTRSTGRAVAAGEMMTERKTVHSKAEMRNNAAIDLCVFQFSCGGRQVHPQKWSNGRFVRRSKKLQRSLTGMHRNYLIAW